MQRYYFCKLWWRQSRKPTQDCHLEHSNHLSDRCQAPWQNHEPQPVAIQVPHGEMPYAVLLRNASCCTMCFDWPYIAPEIETRTFVPSNRYRLCSHTFLNFAEKHWEWSKYPVPKSPDRNLGQRCNTRYIVKKNQTLAFIIISKVKITVSKSIVASIIWRF